MTQQPVVGIDGYPRGWVAVRCDSTGWHWSVAPVSDVATLLASDAVTAIDMPIGLADNGWRACDQLAASQLGSRSSTIFLTPPRRVLEIHDAQGGKDATQELSRELTGAGTSVFALALARRILVLDAALAPRPHDVVVEAHPELSFAELAGRVLDKKTSARGVAQRLAALRSWLPAVDELVADAPPDVPIEDALDALACAWTAHRWSAGTARTLPENAAERPFIAI